MLLELLLLLLLVITPPPPFPIDEFIWLLLLLLLLLLFICWLLDEVLIGLVVEATELKFRLILEMQRSAGRRRFFRRFCSTDLTLGLWTNCSTNRCDCGERSELANTHRDGDVGKI